MQYKSQNKVNTLKVGALESCKVDKSTHIKTDN